MSCRCPLELTGRNSVTPWTRAKRMRILRGMVVVRLGFMGIIL